MLLSCLRAHYSGLIISCTVVCAFVGFAACLFAAALNDRDCFHLQGRQGPAAFRSHRRLGLSPRFVPNVVCVRAYVCAWLDSTYPLCIRMQLLLGAYLARTIAFAINSICSRNSEPLFPHQRLLHPCKHRMCCAPPPTILLHAASPCSHVFDRLAAKRRCSRARTFASLLRCMMLVVRCLTPSPYALGCCCWGHHLVLHICAVHVHRATLPNHVLLHQAVILLRLHDSDGLYTVWASECRGCGQCKQENTSRADVSMSYFFFETQPVIELLLSSALWFLAPNLSCPSLFSAPLPPLAEPRRLVRS